MLSLTITGCDINSFYNQYKVEYDTIIPYEIVFVNISHFLDTEEIYWFKENLHFEIIQVVGMEDKNIEQKINESIVKAITYWMNEDILENSTVDFDIFLQSERYLSFVISFEYVTNRINHLREFITIDMISGDRVMLHDLIYVDEEFAKYIRINNIAKTPDTESSTIFIHDIWVSYDRLYYLENCELLEHLKKASIIPNELELDDLEELIFRNSFYLKENFIVIVYANIFPLHIKFNLYDIENFLKVEKW